MRPPRDDIGAPLLGDDLEWIGLDDPPSMAELAAGGPVLVHFVDLAQLNSVRTLPYLLEWQERYEHLGLSTVIVQSPRFEFGLDRSAVELMASRLGLELPIAIDHRHSLWTDYGCEGWPSLFLWGQGGVLRWFHFGEGEYRATEEAIQEELRSADALQVLPEPMGPIRATDAPGATVLTPTPELFPAGERAWRADLDDSSLRIEYEGGGAHVTVEGEGAIGISLDGEQLEPLDVDAPGLYTLVEHDAHGRHVIDLDLAGELLLWSVSFSAGVPPT